MDYQMYDNSHRENREQERNWNQNQGGWNGEPNGLSGGQNGAWYSGGYTDPDYENRIIKDTRRCFSRTGFVYLAFLAVSILSQIGVGAILAATGLDERLGYNGRLLVTMLSMYPLAVPLTGLLIRWVPARGKVGQERWGLGALCGFFVVSMGVLYAGNMVGTVLMAIGGAIKGEPIINEMQELIMSMEPWTIILSAVIAAPIMEELVFRKFLLDRIAGFGHWTAMVVSGLVFGIAHGNFYQFFYAFGLGMIFAYVYLHTGKIGYTIGFHMVINFWGSVLPLGLVWVLKKNAVIGAFLTIANLMTMFGFIICGVILLAVCWRDLSFQPADDGVSGGKKRRAVWFNFGMILFFIWGAYLFYTSL
ncbi:MAG: CPBP family intramembrane metalloprotease [Hungatella sp.]|nr:CPBP family intramembrane metalloprotease [Hungatella sp.]